MDKDVIKGKAKQVEGKIQDAKGDFTNDPSDDIAGKAKQVEGKVQEAWGKSKDAVRKATR
jgi:uncharacterized protein YjbJ (UPF0337 family)